MNDRMKQIFDQVRAEDSLKASAKAFVAERTRGYAEPIPLLRQGRAFAAAFACLLLLLAGGYRLFFTATAEIGIDINPSLSLGVNRFDRVISVEGLNDDGARLAGLLPVRYLNYGDAIRRIMQDQRVEELLADQEILTITVMGEDEGRSARMLADIEGCTAGQGNTYCYRFSPEEAAAAREAGLSWGKYRAFLELKALDPGVTPEEVMGMTMREIRERIDGLSPGEETAPGGGHGHHGFGGGRWGGE